jgi:hypothetical protein
MPVLNNKYSGLITGGLGLSASHGMLTMGFMVFRVTSKRARHPSHRPKRGFHQKNKHYETEDVSQVTITIRAKGKTWSKSYDMPTTQADYMVKLTNTLQSSLGTVSAIIKKAKSIVNISNYSVKTHD